MSKERIATESIARDVMDTDPIVLRETASRRLVFQASIVDKSGAPVRGYFVYQRKRTADEWEDITGETLTSLRAGEGYKLELHSDEIAAFLQGILDRKEIYEKHGITFGQADFFAGSELPDLVRKVLDNPESDLAVALSELDPESLLGLGRTVELSKLDALLEEWRQNEGSNDEEFWQDLLTRNSWAFSQLTGSPVVLLHAKAYVGGKGVSNSGGGVVDFLLANSLTENVSLVEIKTPGAALIDSQYRTSGAHLPGKELVGGIVQVLGYRDNLMNEIRTLRGDGETYQAYNPRCYVIVGRAQDLVDNDHARRSFELFRASQSGVHVLAFDEVYERLGGIREILVSDQAESTSAESASSHPVAIPAHRTEPPTSDLKRSNQPEPDWLKKVRSHENRS